MTKAQILPLNSLKTFVNQTVNVRMSCRSPRVGMVVVFGRMSTPLLIPCIPHFLSSGCCISSGACSQTERKQTCFTCRHTPILPNCFWNVGTNKQSGHRVYWWSRPSYLSAYWRSTRICFPLPTALNCHSAVQFCVCLLHFQFYRWYFLPTRRHLVKAIIFFS